MSRFRLLLGCCLAVVAISLIFVGVQDTAPEAVAAAPQANAQAIARVMQIQDRNTDRLMAIKGVVGTATGLDVTGQPVVKLFLAKPGIPGIPAKLEGVPVVAEVTGVFVALPKPDKPGKPPGHGGGRKVDPTSRFPRPVPIGVSTGNAGECSAGTIGCRVKHGTDVYALSNNHVYALENVALIGSEVLQPGLYDTDCNYDADNVIGTLYDFEAIVFSTSAGNTIDAAIALTSADELDKATPSNGYGTPKSDPAAAVVNQKVQKYGRTTSLTKGTVNAINATVNVGYPSGTAQFVDQVIVYARKPFIKPGDSGSLLVTDPGKAPVGLLFAGTPDGKWAVANRIDLVLDRFKVTIDGE